MQELFMQLRYNKSYLMFLQGRHTESLEAFKAVREYFVRTESQHHVNLCDLDVAEVYLHLLKPREALTFARKAMAGFSKAAMRYEQAKAMARDELAVQVIVRSLSAPVDDDDPAAGVIRVDR